MPIADVGVNYFTLDTGIAARYMQVLRPIYKAEARKLREQDSGVEEFIPPDLSGLEELK